MDLTNDQLDTIRAWAASDPRVLEVRLFGSRAKGTSRPDSDVDLAITSGSNPSEDAYTVYFFAARQWQPLLTKLLGVQADVERYDQETAPNVYRFCHEASVLLYRRDSAETGTR
jgi:predicted nucleotidyltransferase